MSDFETVGPFTGLKGFAPIPTTLSERVWARKFYRELRGEGHGPKSSRFKAMTALFQSQTV